MQVSRNQCVRNQSSCCERTPNGTVCAMWAGGRLVRSFPAAVSQNAAAPSALGRRILLSCGPSRHRCCDRQFGLLSSPCASKGTPCHLRASKWLCTLIGTPPPTSICCPAYFQHRCRADACFMAFSRSRRLSPSRLVRGRRAGALRLRETLGLVGRRLAQRQYLAQHRQSPCVRGGSCSRPSTSSASRRRLVRVFRVDPCM